MSIPSYPPPSYQPPPKSSSPLKWILFGCLGILVVGGGLIGGCVVLVLQATKPPVEKSEQFLKAASEGKWDEAKGMSDETVKKELDGFVRSYPMVFGKTWTVQGRNINSSNGVTSATITVKLTGTDGVTRDARVNLQKQGEAWVVVGFFVEGLTAPAAGGGPLELADVKVRKQERTSDWRVDFDGNVRGLKPGTKDGKPWVRFHMGFKLVDADGKVVLDEPKIKVIDSAWGPTDVNFYVTLPKDAAGKFTAHLQITDDESGDQISKAVTFDLP